MLTPVMMSREARVAVLGFAAMTMVVTFNLVFFQGKRVGNAFETAAIGSRGAAPVESMATAAPAGDATATTSPQVEPVAARPVSQSVAPPPATALPVTLSRVDIVRGIQRGLGAQGYEPGQADGIIGLMTRAAIMAYEVDSGLALTGEPSEELMRRVEQGTAAPLIPRKGAIEVKNAEAAAIIKNVSQWLAALGYPLQKGELTMSPALVRAIRDFEASQKLPETGRISAPLVARLSRAGQGKAAAVR